MNFTFNHLPIDAVKPLSTTTDKYKFKSTREITNFLESRGFNVWKIKDSRLNKKNLHKQGFQKHIVRLDHDMLKIDDKNRLQITVVNSHDGTTSLKIGLGIYRIVCQNGLVVGKAFEEFSIKHIGQGFYEQIDKALNEVLEVAAKYKELVKSMQTIELNNEQIQSFITKVSMKRLINIENVSEIDYNSYMPKRAEDNKTDLYTVLNVIQEISIRGGLKYKTVEKIEKDGNVIDIFKNRTTRKINSISTDLELNKFIFDTAMEYITKAA